MTEKTTRAVLIAPSIVDDFDDTVTLSLFLYMLCKANVTETPYQYQIDNTLAVTLAQGQMFLNLKSWASRMNVDYKVAYRRLVRLQERKQIGTKTVHKKGIIVTVINLLKYQTFSNYKQPNGNKNGNKTETKRKQEREPYHSDSITQVVSQKDSSSTSLTDFVEPKKAKKTKHTYSQEFESWWLQYPRKVGKGSASKLFEKLTIEEKRAAWKGAEAYSKAVSKWPKESKGFIPHPERWLKKRRWEDDPSEWVRVPDTNTKQETTPKGWTSA